MFPFSIKIAKSFNLFSKNRTYLISLEGTLAVANKLNDEWQSQFASNGQIHVENP